MKVAIKTKRPHTLTLNLSDRENACLERLAKEAETSKSAVLRQALRAYEAKMNPIDPMPPMLDPNVEEPAP